ncbi:MAG: hypothetical protein LBH58_04350 [Tannerellaceae bacterium]|nr:hypothetical protein [Tannerellaceae bacterium]
MVKSFREIELDTNGAYESTGCLSQQVYFVSRVGFLLLMPSAICGE